jgi:hypothetical protein
VRARRKKDPIGQLPEALHAPILFFGERPAQARTKRALGALHFVLTALGNRFGAVEVNECQDHSVSFVASLLHLLGDDLAARAWTVPAGRGRASALGMAVSRRGHRVVFDRTGFLALRSGLGRKGRGVRRTGRLAGEEAGEETTETFQQGVVRAVEGGAVAVEQKEARRRVVGEWNGNQRNGLGAVFQGRAVVGRRHAVFTPDRTAGYGAARGMGRKQRLFRRKDVTGSVEGRRLVVGVGGLDAVVGRQFFLREEAGGASAGGQAQGAHERHQFGAGRCAVGVGVAAGGRRFALLRLVAGLFGIGLLGSRLSRAGRPDVPVGVLFFVVPHGGRIGGAYGRHFFVLPVGRRVVPARRGVVSVLPVPGRRFPERRFCRRLGLARRRFLRLGRR